MGDKGKLADDMSWLDNTSQGFLLYSMLLRVRDSLELYDMLAREKKGLGGAMHLAPGFLRNSNWNEVTWNFSIKESSYMRATEVTAWVQHSLCIPSQNLDPSESFQIFYEVHVVNHNNFSEQFKTLENYQLQIIKHYWYNSSDSLSELEDSDSDGDFVESEHSNFDSCSTGEEDADVSQYSSGLPIAKLKEWQSILRETLLNQHFTMDECTKVANIIHDMRHVHVLNWQHKVWKSAVQKTGLASVLEHISSPDFLPKSGNPHSEYLFRCFCLQKALGAILTKWTPRHIAEGWKEDEELFQPCSLGSVIPPHGAIGNSGISPWQGQSFINIFLGLFGLLVIVLAPMAWKIIGAFKFQCAKALFTDLKDYLHKNEGKLVFDDAQLCTIINRTCELDVEKERYNSWLHQNQPGSRNKDKGHKTKQAMETMQTATDKSKKTKKRKRHKAPKITEYTSLLACVKCTNLPASKKCTQMLEIKWKDLADADIVGHGISLADPENCMVPHETMMPIKCDPEIVKNCQGLTYLLVANASIEPFMEAEKCIASIDHQLDEGGPIEDGAEDTFYWVRHSSSPTLYHLPLKRGKRLGSFMEGDMTGTGSCQPSGGARADIYQPYSALDSTSPAEINTWFDIAMDDMYLWEGARHADPALVRTIWGYYIVTQPNMICHRPVHKQIWEQMLVLVHINLPPSGIFGRPGNMLMSAEPI
ncbi:hypothetical protein EDD18DRAFT_1107301 [Armillaria luteobubalina]|uniref:Uncharacterized protein n=1 Tax=Armillaria luteobubalina TaxID=153913 RepID=A0AA39Q2N4_9AGAR|nr:hypothetical protein EDD18DRAFT_1107301 [Armillaria luteobubalina]